MTLKIAEPSFVNIKVDGKTDPCTRNEDINFMLESLAVEGVLRSGDQTGPADVLLILTNESGTVIAETRTTANGAYRFKAPPGKYMVTGDISLGKPTYTVKFHMRQFQACEASYYYSNLRARGNLLIAED